MSQSTSIFTRLASATALAALAIGATQAYAADPVIFRFATAGDSREDIVSSKFDASSLISAPNLNGGAATALLQDSTFGQNTKAFAKMLAYAKSQRATLFFENGDMIMGYGRAALPPAAFVPATPADYIRKSDLGLFYVEYAYWRGLVSSFIEQGMYVMPVPGNHETQCSNGSNGNPNKANLSTFCAAGKVAYPENEDAWRANVGDLIADLNYNQRFTSTTGFNAGTPLGVLPGAALESPAAAGTNATTGVTGGTQQQLTYSFDIQLPNGGALLHFAVINTDPSGNDGVAPAAWLESDFAAAALRASPSTPVKYFIFGHKAAYSYIFPAATPPAPGDLSANAATRDAFWTVVSHYNATYFCGHEHTWNVSQHADPSATYSTNPYQVLVGSAGSPFEMTSIYTAGNESPYDRYYAYALVEVHASGAVTMSVNGFSAGFGPLTNLGTWTIQ
jgi:hypothetical protein